MSERAWNFRIGIASDEKRVHVRQYRSWGLFLCKQPAVSEILYQRTWIPSIRSLECNYSLLRGDEIRPRLRLGRHGKRKKQKMATHRPFARCVISHAVGGHILWKPEPMWHMQCRVLRGADPARWHQVSNQPDRVVHDPEKMKLSAEGLCLTKLLLAEKLRDGSAVHRPAFEVKIFAPKWIPFSFISTHSHHTFLECLPSIVFSQVIAAVSTLMHQGKTRSR